MNKLLNLVTAVTLMFLSSFATAQEISHIDSSKTQIYQLNIQEEITPKVWRDTKNAYAQADSMGADIFLIHMNTYGGLVYVADSIRTKILDAKIPTYVFIDKNAASAGALISIACDSIYMSSGSNIGAATVVDGEGKKMMDKYQSYMRATMRATAEAHGKDSIMVNGQLQTPWHRNPIIAEAMVDESVVVEGIVDSSKILTFTTAEAVDNGYCEASVEDIPALLEHLNIDDYEIKEYKPSFIESIIGFLVNPVISSLLITAIIGGIYFEMQSPGIGFPLLVAILAALAYFAPLYLDGLANSWEILLFVVGLILIALEVFVVPGFGVTGISGIICCFAGLSLSLIDNVDFNFEHVDPNKIMQAILMVFGSILVATVGSIYLTSKIFGSKNRLFGRLALHETQEVADGFVAVDISSKSLIGELGEAYTVLRLSGKVMVNGKVYDAVSTHEMIDKGESVIIVKQEAAQLYVEKHQAQATEEPS